MVKEMELERYKALMNQSYCLAWAVNQSIKAEKANVLEFKRHSFLMDIYDDWTPVQAIPKASQIGFSTMEILKSFWAMKYKGWNIIYTLPSFSDVLQFVPSKVNAIIGNNPILGEWTKDKDTTLQKKIGNSFIYYRGTVSKKSEENKIEGGVGIMLTSDLNVHDEADRSDQNSLQQYESRLDASNYKGRWYFSNPTHPNTLTQNLWEKSDQKHWFVKCPHCNEWQYLEWPDSIKDGKFVCKKCGGELSDEVRMSGEWIQKYDKDISGYWIPQLIASWHSAKEIEEKFKTTTKDYFYNFVLGLPYRGTDSAIDKDLILKCIDYSTPNFLNDNVMGVDVGLKKHFVIGNKQGIFKVGYAEDWKEIEFMIRKYDIRSCVIDALPDLTEPRKLQEKYLGIIWLSYFKKEIKKATFVNWDSKSHTVYSDRSKMLGLVIDEFVDNKRRFQMLPEDLKLYIKHWKSVYKTKINNSLGIEEEIWDSTGEDHLVFATIYWRLAMMKTGGEIDIIGTPNKYKKDVPTIKEILDSQNTSPDDWKA